jgi:hypothetical protein
LNMVDLDLKSEHSKSVRVNFSQQIWLSLKPNPATRFVNITLDNTSAPVSLGIYDQQGRLIKELNGLIFSRSLNVDLTGITPGLYFVKMQSGDYRETEKLIIR